MHALKHRNVLRFYAWYAPLALCRDVLAGMQMQVLALMRSCARYETSRHLWLVLEYCVGGSLASLLKEDGRLPEEAIHDLGHDLVMALQVGSHALTALSTPSMPPLCSRRMKCR